MLWLLVNSLNCTVQNARNACSGAWCPEQGNGGCACYTPNHNWRAIHSNNLTFAYVEALEAYRT
eukprot:SAG31_NODE_42865_length_269_cov_1.470588_1_plen_63_part_01